MATPVGLAKSTLVDQLRRDELESIASEVDADRRQHILKSLDERGRAQKLVQQHHSGRYPFELLQNANDAAVDAGRSGRVRFVLTDRALIAADNGAGFGEEQIRAICGLARSSKDPQKSVGHKGLGFKSVGEITDRPQVVSDGVAFGFDEQRVRKSVASIAGPLDPHQHLPVYAFPFPLDEEEIADDATVISDARADGFTTLLRLPLREEALRSEVQQQLVSSLLPRLMLFLTGVEEIELRGTDADFSAVVTREPHGLYDEVLLETNGSIAHWLVYGKWIETDRALVEPLGDAWAEVERVQVAVAVPLEADGSPSAETLFPLHVYFPTEEITGLPVVVHGDFALQLDRRQLATSPETAAYNETLIGVAAELLAGTVVLNLAERWPQTAASAAAVTPRVPPTGLGDLFLNRCIEALPGSRFLPAIDGQPRVPAETLLLPEGVPDPGVAHRHLDLRNHPWVAVPALETDAGVRAFLKETLDVEEWPLSEALACLRQPADDELSEYYKFLVDWSEGVGSRRFAKALAGICFVRTAAGDWTAPDERVFFPRLRDDVDIPADLPVPIAQVPDVDGLRALLAEAGVRDFEWRELMRDYLLPILASPDTNPDLRERAMRGLRAYYASQRAGDPVLQRRIGDVLLPAVSAAGDVAALKPASSIYFSSGWTDTNGLEDLYGPFGEVEFLADDPPDDADSRSPEYEFLQWVGVAAHPRVLAVSAEQKDAYMTDKLTRHPHRSLGAHWDEWWSDPVVQAASRCEQGHPSSHQQLQQSFALDRLAELVERGDPEQMKILWSELAENWGAIYESATDAVFRCQHSWHGGERDRNAPSLLWRMLTELPWIPAQVGEVIELVRPHDAWRLAFDTPRWIANRVPILPTTWGTGHSGRLAAVLEVTDAARPSPTDLVELLKGLRDEHEGFAEGVAGLHNAARWAMRTLNDVLATDPDASLEEVPLLAKYQGNPMFTSEPVVALDPLLADTWGDHYPILDADRDLRRLHEALHLVVLDDPQSGVHVTPVPHPDEAGQDTLEASVAEAKPYLGALAVANTPSRRDDVIRGLKRLEVVACTELVLRYSFRGDTIERKEATAFIAVRQEQLKGALRRNIGTAHLEVSPSDAQADWFAFGPQLAQFLQVPTQGDAFALLLSGDQEARKQYLRSRRIPLEEVDSMRDALDLPIDDEMPVETIDLPGSIREPEDSAESETGEGQEVPDPETESTDATQSPEVEDHEPLPDLDTNGITISDVEPGEVKRPDRPPGGGGGGGLGPPGEGDPDSEDRRLRELGRRGEEAALEIERRRVQAFGGNPAAVVWRAKKQRFAPHDIESLDHDGQRIFIEVKSTTNSSPAAPFPISRAELMQAIRKGSRFYIYRVTSVDTATPAVHRYSDPARLLREGKADLGFSGANMKLGDSK